MLNSEKIRSCIKSSNFRFEDVASALNMSRSTLFRKLENNGLTIENINILLRILNVDLTEFLE